MPSVYIHIDTDADNFDEEINRAHGVLNALVIARNGAPVATTAAPVPGSPVVAGPAPTAAPVAAPPGAPVAAPPGVTSAPAPVAPAAAPGSPEAPSAPGTGMEDEAQQLRSRIGAASAKLGTVNRQHEVAAKIAECGKQRLSELDIAQLRWVAEHADAIAATVG